MSADLIQHAFHGQAVRVITDEHGDRRLPFRFWEKVLRAPSGCWLWQAVIGGDGYGRFYLDGTMRRAHRVAWTALVAPVPEGLDLDHLCRNRDCVNPSHMEAVTRAENLRRGAQGYALRGYVCVNGHDVTRVGMRIRPRGKVSVSRGCRQCDMDRAHARSALLSAVCRHLGVTRIEYGARYGWSQDVAHKLLGGTEPVGTTLRVLVAV